MTKIHYIYGLHAIEALLKQHPEKIHTLFIQTGRQDGRIRTLITLAENHSIKVTPTSRASLDKWVNNGVHQGVVAQIAAASSNYLEADLIRFLDTLTHPALLLILDGVQDPRNLGACLRTANAAGVDAVIVPRDKSATLTDVVAKVASGAAETTPLIEVTNLARTLDELKQYGIWIYGASGNADNNLFAGNFSGAIAWVLGAEGKGLRRLTAENCDALYHIPMQGSVSSLNVSVAAGVCLFESVRQRLK